MTEPLPDWVLQERQPPTPPPATPPAADPVPQRRKRHPRPPRRTAAEVAADAPRHMHRRGLEPVEPYPGNFTAPWLAMCSGCGRVRSVSLQRAKQGNTDRPYCKHSARSTTHRITRFEAADMLLERAGYRAVEHYPGSPHGAWAVECGKCGKGRLLALKWLMCGGSYPCDCCAPTPAVTPTGDGVSSEFSETDPKHGGTA